MAKDIFAFLNTAQREAVNTIDGPVLVIAGPGTGKTQLLALRAAKILDKTDTLPQNILCLTYTEVGAKNMRERIASFIGQAAYDIRISTYHGFGSDIIRENSEYFLEYGDSQPIDKIGQFEIMHDIYSKLPASNILWRKEVYLRDALSVISEAKRANLAPEDLRNIASNNNDYIQANAKFVNKHLANANFRSKDIIPKFEALFIDLKNNLTTQELPSNITPIGDLLVTSLALAVQQAAEINKTTPLTKWKNEWLVKDSADKWKFLFKTADVKLNALADIFEQYNKLLLKRNLFDYDDMIIRAVNGLRQHDDLRFNLQEKYQYIMLDEFQDTNLSQLKLIELLTNNPVNEGQPNVLAVGDDDQAIFSFQGADLTNMLKFRQLYKDVKVITLTENWRSHGDVLNLATGVSEQIEERLHKTLGFKNKELIAKNPKLKQSKIERINFKSDVAELGWIAKQIKHEIEQGTKPSEIAVIAPRHKYLEPLVAYLNQHNIPVRYDKREDVFEDPQILDLLNMAILVMALSKGDNQTANSLWPIVLSSPHWALATSKIWQLSWLASKNTRTGEGSSEWLALMAEDEIFKPIGLFFAKLALITNSATLEQMLDYLVGVESLELNEPDLPTHKTPYHEYYFGEAAMTDKMAKFQHLLSNLTVLRQHIREYKKDDDKALKLNDFIEFYNSYQQAGEKLLNTSPYHDSQVAVQLLTAYGSKGLEFEIVFTVGTLDDVWGMKARGGSSKITLPPNLDIIKRAGQTKDERKRLFFVALSRAKHTVYATSHSQNYTGKNMTWLEFMDETEDQEGVVSSPFLTGIKQVKHSDFDQPSIEILQNFWHTNHVDGVNDPELNDLLKPRLEGFQLSATDLNHFTDLIHGGPQSYLLHKLLKFPQGPSSDGQYGNAMHETLETVLNIFKKEGELPDTDQIQGIYEKKLNAKKMSKDDFKRQLEKGQTALEIFIPQWWQNFNPSSEAEVGFRDEGCFVGKAHLSGNLDQLIVDHEDKLVEVIDFKTGKPASKWNNSDAKLHKYRQQLLFYNVLLKESHSYKNFTPVTGRIVYVEPDEDQRINELWVDYQATQKDIERTKNLISAVWNCITNLDFPDTSEFKRTAKGIRDFEDYLIKTYS